MAGDKLQSIYNYKEHSWSKLGINMRGGSEFLKICYRTGKDNSVLALKFLQENEALKEEVISCVNSLIRNYKYSYKDILIVCNFKSQCEKIKSMLPSNIRSNTRFIKDADKEDMDTCLLTSTYYSSKGLESKVVILVDVDFFSGGLNNKKEIMDRKLLYVGMTRASEKLIIHAKNFNKNSFAKDIKNLYEGYLKLA